MTTPITAGPRAVLRQRRDAPHHHEPGRAAYVAAGFSDLPSIPDFEDRYCGDHESFTDYAHGLAEDIGLLDDVPEEVARYFNWEAWTRDLGYDYTTTDSPNGGVFIFRNQ